MVTPNVIKIFNASNLIKVQPLPGANSPEFCPPPPPAAMNFIVHKLINTNRPRIFPSLVGESFLLTGWEMRVKIKPWFNPERLIVNCGLFTASDSTTESVLQKLTAGDQSAKLYFCFRVKQLSKGCVPILYPVLTEQHYDKPHVTHIFSAVKFTSWPVRLAVLIGFCDRVTWNSPPSEIWG